MTPCRGNASETRVADVSRAHIGMRSGPGLSDGANRPGACFQRQFLQRSYAAPMHSAHVAGPATQAGAQAATVAPQTTQSRTLQPDCRTLSLRMKRGWPRMTGDACMGNLMVSSSRSSVQGQMGSSRTHLPRTRTQQADWLAAAVPAERPPGVRSTGAACVGDLIIIFSFESASMRCASGCALSHPAG